MWWAIKLFAGTLAKPILDFLNNRTSGEVEKFKSELQAQVEVNKLKAQSNGWWGAQLIILCAGVPASLHMGAVFLDTVIPPYGSWGIPKLPAPYDFYEWAIVQSFFIVMPVQTFATAVSRYLNK